MIWQHTLETDNTLHISDLDFSTAMQYHIIYEPEAAKNTDRHFSETDSHRNSVAGCCFAHQGTRR